MKPVGQLDGALWRIIWFRVGDRLAHRIEVLDGGEFHEVLTSIEGTSDESWPPSPPLQEVHFEPRPGGSQVALLVGMAGKSHWSASVEMSADGQRATFELACRAKTQPERLGSVYDVSRSVEPEVLGGHLHFGPFRVWLESCSHQKCASIAWCGISAADVTTEPRPLQIAVRHTSTDWPQTVRWAYSIERDAVDGQFIRDS